MCLAQNSGIDDEYVGEGIADAGEIIFFRKSVGTLAARNSWKRRSYVGVMGPSGVMPENYPENSGMNSSLTYHTLSTSSLAVASLVVGVSDNEVAEGHHDVDVLPAHRRARVSRQLYDVF